MGAPIGTRCDDGSNVLGIANVVANVVDSVGP
jgi:hypothetical protein